MLENLHRTLQTCLQTIKLIYKHILKYIMEDSKRDLIHKNIDNLIKTTDYGKLKAECMINGLLFQEMIDKIEV